MPSPITRRRFVCWLAPASGLCLTMRAEDGGLEPRVVDERIRVAAPQLRFLEGAALERLRNGAPVPYALELALSMDRWATVAQRDIERFVLSYDLWEERFSIAKMGHPRKSISHLTARAAETWCVDELSLPCRGMPDRQQFWVRLQVRAENPAEQAELDRQDSMSLTRLIEIFSRRTRKEQTGWVSEAGPLRLAELRKRGAGARP
jgi:hypothetical protein